jgi:hypothetical protein
MFAGMSGAAMLGQEIKAAQRAGDADAGDTYCCHWPAARARMVPHQGIARSCALKRCHGAWGHAADGTPQGAPIELRASGFAAE